MLQPEILELVEKESWPDRVEKATSSPWQSEYWQKSTAEQRIAFAQSYANKLKDNSKVIWNRDMTAWIRSPIRFLTYGERAVFARDWWFTNGSVSHSSLNDRWAHSALLDATEIILLHNEYQKKEREKHLSEEQIDFFDSLHAVDPEDLPGKPLSMQLELIVVQQKLETPEHVLIDELEKQRKETTDKRIARRQLVIGLVERADLILIGTVASVHAGTLGMNQGRVDTYDQINYTVIGFLRSMSSDDEQKEIAVSCNARSDAGGALLPLPAIGETNLVFVEFDPTTLTNPYALIGTFDTPGETRELTNPIASSVSLMTPMHGCIHAFTIPMRENFFDNLTLMQETIEGLIAIENLRSAEKVCKAVLSKMVPGNSRWKAPFFDLLAKCWEKLGRDGTERALRARDKCLSDSGQ